LREEGKGDEKGWKSANLWRIGISQNYLSTTEHGNVQIGSEILLIVSCDFGKSFIVLGWSNCKEGRNFKNSWPSFRPSSRIVADAVRV
jgi:hypothetical protein